MNELFTIALLWSTVRTATPLILHSLSRLFPERSGVTNIASRHDAGRNVHGRPQLLTL